MLYNVRMAKHYLVGIDEVGRGPIAGPVAVGIFIFSQPYDVHTKAGLAKATKQLRKIFPDIKESKQLSEKKREMWFAEIEKIKKKNEGSTDIDFAVVFQSQKNIDSKGISHCIRLCIEKGLSKLTSGIDPDDVLVLLDGGLKAPERFKHQRTIIRGDVQEPIIALASICAKVTRDRRMRTVAKAFPEYGFDIHKGYGTKAHYDAIRKCGVTGEHRKSFLKSLLLSL